MTAEPDWIVFAAVDWWYHNRAHSEIQLARRASRTRSVLFINSIGMRMPLPGRSSQPWKRLVRKVRSLRRGLSQPDPDRPTFWVMTPLFLPFHGVAAVQRINAVLLTLQVRRAARRAGIDINRAVGMVTVPTAWPAARRLGFRKLIYNRSDKHSAFGEANQSVISDLEQSMFDEADVVLYACRALMDDERGRAKGSVHFLDHGVDVDLFDPSITTVPEDLRGIPRPIVGFFGGLDDYVVDFDLIERVARELPDASVVLIGGATCDMDRLTSLPNVYWLGQRDYAEIPAYGAAFDVGIMPWLDNEWIRSANPIKLKEYLALGLPVVSTRYPEARHYLDWIAVADNDDQFIEMVREAIGGRGVSSAAERRQAVVGATWDARADELLAIGDT